MRHTGGTRAWLYRPGLAPIQIAVTAMDGWLTFTVPEIATYAVVHLPTAP